MRIMPARLSRSCARPQGLLLFGGSVEVQHTQRTASVGGIRLRIDAQTAVLIKALREALDGELTRRVAHPDVAAKGSLLPTIAALLQV